MGLKSQVLRHVWMLLLVVGLSLFVVVSVAADDAPGDLRQLPGSEQLPQKIPRGHPRIWFRPGEFELLEEPGRLGVKIGYNAVSFRVDMRDVVVSCRGIRPDGPRTMLDDSR